MAGCSARLIFHIFSCKSGGSTNDSLAWEISDLRHLIEVDKRLPEPFYIVGDEAFTTTSQLLSPWPGKSLGPWKDSFNYHLSCMRQCGESVRSTHSKVGNFLETSTMSFQHVEPRMRCCSKVTQLLH